MVAPETVVDAFALSVTWLEDTYVAIVAVRVPPPEPAPLTVIPLPTMPAVNGPLAELSVEEPLVIEPFVAIWPVIVNLLPGHDDEES
jgi:hypothetical protein